MTSLTTTPASLQPKAETAVQLFDDWFDPIETAVRERVRESRHHIVSDYCWLFCGIGTLPVGPIAVTCKITSPSFAHA